MFENAMRLMAKQQVALDVLSYHATAQPDEVAKLKVGPFDQNLSKLLLYVTLSLGWIFLYFVSFHALLFCWCTNCLYCCCVYIRQDTITPMSHPCFSFNVGFERYFSIHCWFRELKYLLYLSLCTYVSLWNQWQINIQLEQSTVLSNHASASLHGRLFCTIHGHSTNSQAVAYNT